MNRTDRPFEAPGEGSWDLDAEHCPRPRSRYTIPIVEGVYSPGFAEGMERYGSLLDTFACRFVHGFSYVSPRPVVGPPAGDPPPRLLFKVLCWVHPTLRARIRRAQQVVDQRLWREDFAALEQRIPEVQGALAALQGVALEPLSDEALLDHLDEVTQWLRDIVYEHFAEATASFVPVGGFAIQTMEWTGCTAAAALGALQGSSPASVQIVDGSERLREVLAGHDEARALLGSDEQPATVVERLRDAEGPVGEAMRQWMARYGQWVITGLDAADRRLVEMPRTVVDTLRGMLDGASERSDGGSTAAALRRRVPNAHRARFDDLLDEARRMYGMRDAHAQLDYWALGILRRALLEVGRRLHDAGRIARPDAAVDLDRAETVALLEGDGGPTPDEIAERTRWREQTTAADVPSHLGAEPGPPPPAAWLPEGASRVHGAIGFYAERMFGGADGGASKGDEAIAGIGASRGRSRGPARLVRTPDDFDRVTRGDILVAPITTPTFNAILPLLGGVVTDRGGLLSHPAIVAREYGIPGVVGTGAATERIPEGAEIEIDGEAGTVRVLA